MAEKLQKLGHEGHEKFSETAKRETDRLR